MDYIFKHFHPTMRSRQPQNWRFFIKTFLPEFSHCLSRLVFAIRTFHNWDDFISAMAFTALPSSIIILPSSIVKSTVILVLTGKIFVYFTLPSAW